MARALDLADRAYVPEEGRIVTGGPAATLRAQPHIQQGYLGLRDADDLAP